ncbi:MAG: response regulator [Planctomycetota bacterium]
MGTTSNLVRTVRLSDADIDAVMEKLDAAATPQAASKRHAERFAFRIKGCVVHMQMPGSAGPTPYLVPTRDISATGLSFLHGGFIYPGTRCVVQLISMHGAWENATATVMRCDYIEEMLHEVGIAFDTPIDPGQYCALANKTRILLAEDDPSITRLATALLKKLNVEVDHAENGQVVVEKAMSNVYDAIMMDVEMPVLDGLGAVKQLREKGYGGMIIAATGLTRNEDKQRCLEAGCDRYIGKPYTSDALAKMIGSFQQEPLLSSLAQDRSMLELIDAFVTELPQKIRDVEEAFAKEDNTKLEFLSRLLKAEAGSYGFEPISAVASKVETALMEGGSRMDVKKLMDDLVNLCCMARSSARRMSEDES